MKSAICTEFVRVSEYVHDWCQKQSSVGEESITDWILFELSKSVPQIKYMKFTKSQEARKSGADWEWWFVDNRHFIRLRIQAKRIKNSSEDLYPKLLYSSRKHGLQIDKLINDAQTNNAIPLYAWYYDRKSEKTMCGDIGLHGSKCGVFIASAIKLNSEYVVPAKKPVVSNDLLQYTNPMPCLVCCPLASRNKVQGIFNYLSNYYKIENRKLLQPLKKLPNHIKLILGQNEVENWFEKEFKHWIDDVNSIVVVDLREEIK